MTGALVLYTNPKSRGRAARWMLEEVGQPDRVEPIPFGAAMRAPAFLALNRVGKVPTLTHGDVVVAETAAICASLADAFPAAGLAPDPARRGASYRWLFFAAGPLEAAIVDAILGTVLPAGRSGLSGYGSLAATLDTLERAVRAGDYLAGDGFTAADLHVGWQIGFGTMFWAIRDRPAARQPGAPRMTARRAEVPGYWNG